MLSRCIPKSLRGVKPTLKFSSRLYHNAVAKFTNIDKKGMPVSYDTGIMIGEPGESYICIEPDIGKAFRRAVVSQLGSDGAHQVVTLPLRFDHRSLHFIHQSFPLPRIEIHQNLGDSKHDVSSATLWLTGNWNAITLDGSPDEDFERMSRETAVKLKGALDKLKDS
ncbi:uncharacterized protein FRV6_08735 [Fusarium oxysporum]|uniref:Uncharacterized protein n=1 Tax=Fusarium oxysporum TaxID=5507 RepID=A0A2H3T792_FUSOX|nr:uncharacterized protein FRV6_08735 [Fusarium oxysporum]